MIIVLGEILIDCFPEYERIGGAPFNFAYHLKKMGWSVRFLSRVGDDRQGHEIINTIKENGFAVEDIQVDRDHPTGTVRVNLDDQGVPQFRITQNVAYDYLDLSSLNGNDSSDWKMIYFGTLAQRTEKGFIEVQTFLDKKSKGVHYFCDINLRPPHFVNDTILASLHQATVLKLNEDELKLIRQICDLPDQFDQMTKDLIHTYDIDVLALTKGEQGSIVIAKDKTYHSVRVDVDGLVDTVGAGDAYAAVLAAGYLKGIPMPKTLELASKFAATICAQAGAIPESDRVYQDSLHEFKRSNYEG